MARQGADAVAVRLGSLFGQPQAQLDGFKSRALRSEASTARHLYLTEWRSLDAATAQSGATLVIGSESWTAERERLSPSALRHKLAAMVGEDWAVIVATVAMERKCFAALPLFALEVALALVQVQAAIACAPAVWLLSRVMQMPGQPEHAGSWGLARSARAEASLPVQYIDGAATMVVEQHWALAEVEAVMRHDARLVPRLARAHQAAHTTMAPAASAHVVTGGTGGLGLLTARWLAQRGDARTLALASRSGVLARGSVVEWKGLHATSVATLVQRCDTAEGAHVGRLMAHVTGAASGMGVWHAAGVLADGVLPGQTAERLARVYAPKAHGAWALHCAFSRAVVRTHALFSSVAALLGGAGQANYSAANACLDALGSYRRTCARAAMSVQWGAWAEVGMAARGAAAERMAAMETASGFGRLGLAQGLGALHAAVLPRASSLVGVVPVQWGRMLRDGAVPAFLSSMAAPALAKEGSVATVEQRAACAISSLEAVLEMVRRTAGGAVDADAPLMEAGVDSLGAVELRNQLQRAVGDGVALSSTLMFDHPTARALALASADSSKHDAAFSIQDNWALALTTVAAVDIRGASCVLPASCHSPTCLWHATTTASDFVVTAPLLRWGELVNDDGQVVPQDGAFVTAPELFDAACFQIAHVEASVMDMQQRLVLENMYSAIRNSGRNRTQIHAQAVGVYVGIWADTGWGRVLDSSMHAKSAYRISASSCSMAAGRVSYCLGLRGPSFSVDTACTAGLTACHIACGAVLSSECESAVAAGVNMNFFPDMFAVMNGFKQVNGRCYSFDHRASGFVASEGCVAAVVNSSERTRAAASLAARVVCNVTRCAGKSASLTAPNAASQLMLLRTAWHTLGQHPHVVEAHGSGTPLGDPIEVQAVLRALTDSEEKVCIGALKAHVGHMLPTSGMASLVKSTLMLKHQKVSPNALLRVLHPNCAMLTGCREQLTFPTDISSIPLAKATCGITNIAYSGQLVHFVIKRGHDSSQSHETYVGFRRRQFSVGTGHLRRKVDGTDDARSMNTDSAVHTIDPNCSMIDIVAHTIQDTFGYVDPDAPVMEAGVDSLGAAEISSRMSIILDRELGAPLIFNFPTIRQLGEHLGATLTAKSSSAPRGMANEPSPTVADPGQQLTMTGVAFSSPGAIVGEASLALMLESGCDRVQEVPVARWDLCLPHTNKLAQRRARHGGIILMAELFDAVSFRVSPLEAMSMDPQQRMLLEHAATVERRSVPTSDAVVGVFLGITSTEFGVILSSSPLADGVFASTGSSLSVASGRISFALDLQGPCVSYETACSASLVANHGSMRALLFDECDLSLASGVNLMLLPSASFGAAVAGMTSARGRSHTFDARADGYVRGEACCGVALRRADEASLLAWERGASGRAECEPDGSQRPGAAGLARRRVARCEDCRRQSGAPRGARHGHGARRPD